MARPKVNLLSTDRIADAALDLVDSGEPFGVNALARRLSVTPSSLYNHVDGRDAIVELMRRRMVERDLDLVAPQPWEALVPAVLRAQRRMYARHPQLIPLIVDKTITDPLVIEQYDILATALVEGGFPAGDVIAIIGVLDAFAIGFGLDLASPADVWRPDIETRTFGRLLEGAETGDERSDHVFEIGVDMLLESLHARLARTGIRDA
jgi:AcrR family transcriptional regulator